MPAPLHINEPSYSFVIDYKKEGQKLLYKKEITIRDTHLRKTAFQQWNTHIQQLKKTYNEQVTLVKK